MKRVTSTQILDSIKFYGNALFTIAKYFYLFPLAINLLRANTTQTFIEALVSYPESVIIITFYGSLFGLLSSMYYHRFEIKDEFPEHIIEIISIAIDELYIYSDYKYKQIIKKINMF